MEFKNALVCLNRIRAEEILEQNYCNFNSKVEAIEKIVVKALDEIGLGWQDGSISLSQVYMSSIICEDIINSILPENSIERKSEPRMAIAVLEDYHILGKRIVYSVLRSSGYNLLDYGHGIKVDELVDKVVDDNVKILLISVLMLPSALKVKKVVEKLRGRRMDTKIIVGGAPFRLDENLWKEVGADATAINGTDAIKVIEKVVQRL